MTRSVPVDSGLATVHGDHFPETSTTRPSFGEAATKKKTTIVPRGTSNIHVRRRQTSRLVTERVHRWIMSLLGRTESERRADGWSLGPPRYVATVAMAATGRKIGVAESLGHLASRIRDQSLIVTSAAFLVYVKHSSNTSWPGYTVTSRRPCMRPLVAQIVVIFLPLRLCPLLTTIDLFNLSC